MFSIINLMPKERPAFRATCSIENILFFPPSKLSIRIGLFPGTLYNHVIQPETLFPSTFVALTTTYIYRYKGFLKNWKMSVFLTETVRKSWVFLTNMMVASSAKRFGLAITLRRTEMASLLLLRDSAAFLCPFWFWGLCRQQCFQDSRDVLPHLSLQGRDWCTVHDLCKDPELGWLPD